MNFVYDLEGNFFLGLIVMRDFASIKCLDSFRPKAKGLFPLVGVLAVVLALEAWLLY